MRVYGSRDYTRRHWKITHFHARAQPKYDIDCEELKITDMRGLLKEIESEKNFLLNLRVRHACFLLHVE